MLKVAIVYYSAQGHTHQLAEAVAEGVALASGVEAKVFRIVGEDIPAGRWQNATMLDEISACDAIVLGTPTYMGGYSAQIKAFIDATSGIWYKQGWKNKIAAGFTHSSGLSGDKLDTLFGLMVNAMQHGMIWVGQAHLVEGTEPEHINRLSSFTGAMAQTGMGQDPINTGDRKTAVLFGTRIAETVLRWNK